MNVKGGNLSIILKLENEFIELVIGDIEEETTITVLNEDKTAASTCILTGREFDNLCHLIIDNQDKIFKKVCFEKQGT